MEFCLFSKFFQSMDADRLGKTISKLGLSGVDLTCREGGHIDVSKADIKEELPRFRETLAKHGIKISILTTRITSIKSAKAEDIIETAGRLGIKYLKLGYWKYEGFGSYRKQAEQIRKDLAGLEPLLRKNKVKAGFHTHSAESMGLNANHALRLIEKCDPEVIGIYYDIGHSTMEGSLGGWMMDLDIASDRIFMVAIKDMSWFPIEGKKDENREKIDPVGYRYNKKWKYLTVPLDRGLSDLPAFIKILKQISFTGPVSLHSEYGGFSSWRILKTDELLEQTRKDLEYVKSLL
jgi:sugar phosphate isomerase/epimerase